MLVCHYRASWLKTDCNSSIAKWTCQQIEVNLPLDDSVQNLSSLSVIVQLHNCLKAFKVSFKAFLCPKILCQNGAWLHSSFFFSAKTAHWRSAATPCQSFFYMLLSICFRLLEVHVRCSQILLLSRKFMSDNSEVAVSQELIEQSSELPIILCNAHQTWFDGPWKHGLLVHSLCE
jgi:hypothetical protein